MDPYKILVWGDSIARQNTVPWPEHCQQHLTVSCFCGRPVKFFNIARCGMPAVSGQNLFDSKVKQKSPHLTIIQFGFNDLRFDASFGANPIATPEEYKNAMRNMIRNARSTGSDVLVLGNHNFSFGNLILYPNGMNGDEAVELYRSQAEEAAKLENADYINMAEVFQTLGISPVEATSDGCHLSDCGIRIYTLTVCRYILNKLLKTNQ